MYIKVKVKAGAKTETLEEIKNNSFSISVREPAKRNLANRRVIELVAGQFKCPIGKVRIINGHNSPSKLLSVDID